MWPAYTLTTKDGFIAYLGDKTNRPESVDVNGATSTYDKESGRLTIRNVKGNVSITAPVPTALENISEDKKALKTIYHGQLIIIKNGKAYNSLGMPVSLVD